MPTYDPTQKRRTLRKARERGCTVYIPAEVLEQAGFDLDGEPPDFRVWASRQRKGAILIQLYERGSNGSH